MKHRSTTSRKCSCHHYHMDYRKPDADESTFFLLLIYLIRFWEQTSFAMNQSLIGCGSTMKHPPTAHPIVWFNHLWPNHKSIWFLDWLLLWSNHCQMTRMWPSFYSHLYLVKFHLCPDLERFRDHFFFVVIEWMRFAIFHLKTFYFYLYWMGDLIIYKLLK